MLVKLVELVQHSAPGTLPAGLPAFGGQAGRHSLEVNKFPEDSLQISPGFFFILYFLVIGGNKIDVADILVPDQVGIWPEPSETVICFVKYKLLCIRIEDIPAPVELI